MVGWRPSFPWMIAVDKDDVVVAADAVAAESNASTGIQVMSMLEWRDHGRHRLQ